MPKISSQKKKKRYHVSSYQRFKESAKRKAPRLKKGKKRKERRVLKFKAEKIKAQRHQLRVNYDNKKKFSDDNKVLSD